MSLSTTKALIAVATVSTVAVFYDEAITTAQSLVGRTRAAMASAELSQYDRRLVAHWDMRGAPPRDIRKVLRSEFDSGGGKSIFTDHWGSPYVLEAFDDGYLLLSAGPDRRRGSADDVFIRRRGREVETALDWVESPEELIAPMKELAEKQARIAERSAPEGDAEGREDAVELEFEAALREFRGLGAGSFTPTADDR